MSFCTLSDIIVPKSIDAEDIFNAASVQLKRGNHEFKYRFRNYKFRSEIEEAFRILNDQYTGPKYRLAFVVCCQGCKGTFRCDCNQNRGIEYIVVKIQPNIHGSL